MYACENRQSDYNLKRTYKLSCKLILNAYLLIKYTQPTPFCYIE